MMATLTEGENMAKDKPAPPPYELTKIEAELLETARFVVAMERQLKGREKARTLAAYLSDCVRAQVHRDHARYKKELAQD